MKHAPAYAVLVLGFAILIATERWRDGRFESFIIKTSIVKVDSLQQIVLLTDSLVAPVMYKNVPGLDKLPFPQVKAKFIAAMLPAILVAKHQMETKKNKLLWLRDRERWCEADSTFFTAVKDKYNARDLDDLIQRVGTLPNSIVLAQAAIETGWGRSRFFVEASNVFGIWSVNANESRIAAGKTRENRTIYLRSYNDLSSSVADYFDVLSRARVYRGLRRARRETTDPFKLTPHLKYYSERRSSYVRLVNKVIVDNNLTKYDHYQIDPHYVIAE